MNRRAFLGTLTGGLLAAPLAATVPESHVGKVARVGVLSSGVPGPNPGEAFDQGLRELGWIEGQSLVIERRYAGDSDARLYELAAELIQLKVDVILAPGPRALQAANALTTTIPIVMVAATSDPVGKGFARSLARPGGNITGMATAPAAISTKRLDLLKETVSSLSRVGILWDADVGPYRPLEGFEAGARALGLKMLPFVVREPAEYEAVIRAAATARVGGFWVLGAPRIFRDRRQIAGLLIRYRLPAIAEWRELAEAGLLMTYGPRLRDEFRRAAAYVDKILKGAKPADLPIERPVAYELVINLKTATALGLTIPPSLLARADQVIDP